MEAICAVCLKNEKKPQRCTRCQSVWYCSKDCQSADWKNHRPYCKERSAYMRGLTSTDIAACEDKERFIQSIQRFVPKLLSLWFVSMNHWNRRKQPLRIEFSQCRNKILDIRFVPEYTDESTALCAQQNNGSEKGDVVMLPLVFIFADGKRVTIGVPDHCLHNALSMDVRESEYMSEQFLRTEVQEMYAKERAKGISQCV